MLEYQEIICDILEEGVWRNNRTGTPTLSIFNYNYTLDLVDTSWFPLLTTKYVSWKNIVVETMWYLTGSTTIEYLHKHGCHFWDPWADERHNLKSSYGQRWRQFGGQIDQLAEAIALLKKDPTTRRAIVSAWNPWVDYRSSLPPCHVLFGFHLQDGALSLHLTQRSCDVAVGLPYNIACYSLLIHMVARFLGCRVGKFAHSVIDMHIYESHIPGLREQLLRQPKPPPALKIAPEIRSLDDVDKILYTATTDELLEIFKLVGYNPWPPIKYDVLV